VDLKEEDSEEDKAEDDLITIGLPPNKTLQDETTTVFDLVHRGRQRQEHFKAL
jgi:hypothetical protein